MQPYKATVNLPESKRGEVKDWPDTPRTAVLVNLGILIPPKRDHGVDEPPAPVNPLPGGTVFTPTPAETWTPGAPSGQVLDPPFVPHPDNPTVDLPAQ